MPSKNLIPRIQEVLGDEELSVSQIMTRLKKQNDSQKESSKRTTSFTTQQVSQIMRRKMFEKAGWCNKRGVNLWRNKYVMDRKI
tara:strand:- start:59 stop:310 length:252 start_codon:yes stop_codon:yes gene_type:complete